MLIFALPTYRTLHLSNLIILMLGSFVVLFSPTYIACTQKVYSTHSHR